MTLSACKTEGNVFFFFQLLIYILDVHEGGILTK